MGNGEGGGKGELQGGIGGREEDRVRGNVFIIRVTEDWAMEERREGRNTERRAENTVHGG